MFVQLLLDRLGVLGIISSKMLFRGPRPARRQPVQRYLLYE
jgi:hypothetical protein